MLHYTSFHVKNFSSPNSELFKKYCTETCETVLHLHLSFLAFILSWGIKTKWSNTFPCAFIHSHSYSLSLSLSQAHTHTHTHTISPFNRQCPWLALLIYYLIARLTNSSTKPSQTTNPEKFNSYDTKLARAVDIPPRWKCGTKETSQWIVSIA